MRIDKALGAITIMSAMLLGACGAKKQAATPQDAPLIEVKQKMVGGEDAVAVRPQATAFKMSGDYASNVAIMLNEDGSLAYYPAPSDLTDKSAPLPLIDGWYLNRQGIGPGAVFTSYTFERYRALSVPPTHEELLRAIIPGAGVIEFVELPIHASEALAHPELCLEFLPK